MNDPSRPGPATLAAIDDAILRVRRGERLRAVATDTGGGRTVDTTGEIWFDGHTFHLRLHRRLRREPGAWAPTSVEDRTLDEDALRLRLSRDPELRALVGVGA